MPEHLNLQLTSGEPEEAVRRVDVQSTAERVYHELLRAILSGAIRRGEVLKQESLARRLGVSRTPVREALMRLASEGLVRLEAHHGARVTGLDFGDMQHAWRARIVLESGAARLAAAVRSPEALRGMHDALKRQCQPENDLEDNLRANRDFHLALVAASENPYLIRFAEMLWSFQIAVPIFGRQALEPREIRLWVEDHRKILEAVEAGNVDAAEELTRRHIAAYPPPSS